MELKQDIPTISEFLAKKLYESKDSQIVMDEGGRYWVFADKKFYDTANDYTSHEAGEAAVFEEFDDYTDNCFPAAILIKKGNKPLIILNGDEDLIGYVQLDLFEMKAPTISFSCFSRIFNTEDPTPEDIKGAVGDLINGKFKIVDFTEDREVALTKEEKRQVSNFKRTLEWKNRGWEVDGCAVIQRKLSPPDKTFTLIKGSRDILTWHAPATILLKEVATDKHYIFGQDEGTYFGCELATKPRNVKQAFDQLIPAEIRKVEGVIRQGEWFAVPVPVDKLPGEHKAIVTLDQDCDDQVTLPKDDPDSNPHLLLCDEGYVAPEGIFVKNFTLQHSEHASLCGKENTWYTFKKNTAVRSFSQDGVD